MGEEQAAEFTAFVRDQGTRLLRTAALLTGDRSSAEDLVQSALATAYGKWSRVCAADDPAAYVHRLMVNTHLSWRRRLSSTERPTTVIPERAGPDAQAAFADTEHVRAALLRLSPRMRTAVVLRYFEDLSEADTARVMGCSVSTVNNHVGKGLARLRGLLSADDGRDLTTSRSRP